MGHNVEQRRKFSLVLHCSLCYPLVPHCWSLDEWSFEILGVASVRTSIRASAKLFLRNRSLLFSETLHLVRACKCKKNVSSTLLIIFTVLAILAKNAKNWPLWPKMTNNRTVHQFINFFSKNSLLESKK